MNIKRIIELSVAHDRHESSKSDPTANVSTGSALYKLESDFSHLLRDFVVRPTDVTRSELHEFSSYEGCTVPNYYTDSATLWNRKNGLVGRSRVLRLPPISAIAQFTLLGAIVRFRSLNPFVEFHPPTGEYYLCLPAGKGIDEDCTISPPTQGAKACIMAGEWNSGRGNIQACMRLVFNFPNGSSTFTEIRSPGRDAEDRFWHDYLGGEHCDEEISWNCEVRGDFDTIHFDWIVAPTDCQRIVCEIGKALGVSLVPYVNWKKI